MTVRYVIRCEVCAVDAPLTGQLLGVLSAQVTAFRAIHDHDPRGCAVDTVPLPAGDAVSAVTSEPAEMPVTDYEVIAADGRRWSHSRPFAAA